MTPKRWLCAFFITLFALTALIAAFNAATDPFGVFGDPFFDWYSYNFTNNPRAAKTAYLNENYPLYDSYILGASGSSALHPDVAELYIDGRFFNLFAYGADMYDSELILRHILDNFELKNLIISVGLESTMVYNAPKTELTRLLHSNVDGSSAVLFYLRYLFANPKYGIEKLKAFRADTYMPQTFDVFETLSGCYDKSERDAEAFGELGAYYDTYPAFQDYEEKLVKRRLYHIDDCVNAVDRMLALCRENGVSVTVLVPPIYAPSVAIYEHADIEAFFTKLAAVTEFWDFSISPVSTDPRYFYDTTHFRNAVGAMMLARMHGDTAVYYPGDFGRLVTQDTASDAALSFFSEPENESFAVRVPVLTYHHLAEQGDGGATMSAALFEQQMYTLKNAGFETVSLQQLTSFVEQGAALPEKPVLLTFDDGYMSNYTTAYPILRKLGMKAVFFPIGVSVGKETYKDTGKPIIPHYGTAEIAEMAASGLIEFGSHSYDMHQSESYDGSGYRNGVLPKDGESEQDYITAFLADLNAEKTLLLPYTGRALTALAYPNGLHSKLTATILRQEGVKITFTTNTGINTLVKGLDQTLINLKRISVNDSLSPELLLERLNGN